MTYSKGLEGVIAAETAISNVEGDIGRLTYRGYRIEDLVQKQYEEVIWLVLFGELPVASETARLKSFLLQQGELSSQDLAVLRVLDRDLHPMRMLQGMVPVLQLPDVEFDGLDIEGSRGLAIIARLPMLIASYRQLQLGHELPANDDTEEYLPRFLGMYTGKSPLSEHVEILNVIQILQMEHSLNAGTFTSRVASSTLAPIESVISSAVGALFGILHGGADEAALNDAKRTGCPENARAFVEQLLKDKRKLMGMGHREYRVVDPRSNILKPMARKLCMGTEFENNFLTLSALEKEFNLAMKARGKDVWANLEFYKGAAYEAIGIPSHYFTSVFAMARSVGWLAHFIESRQDNRLIRPKAEYTGPAFRMIG